MADLTPMMKQYMKIKKENPGSILMFRLGDFYEMFFEDAITAARELEITLTGRNCGQDEKAPMCGVPFHAVDSYITRLVAKGYKVAICEQMEDPATAKGIVKREIIRTITPGTVLDEALLDSRKTNYMASIFREGDKSAAAFVDASTGEMLGIVLNNDKDCDKLINELTRFAPVEIALGGSGKDHKRLLEYIKSRTGVLCFTFDEKEIEKSAKNIVDKQLKNSSEIEDRLLLIASAAIIDYLLEMQKVEMTHLREINIYTSNEFLEIDAVSQHSLELVESMRDKSKRGSLLWVLDHTKTSMGLRMLKSWVLRPLVNAPVIMNRLDSVEELVNNMQLRDDLIESLSSVQDIERLMGRVSIGVANARDLISLKNSFKNLPNISKLLCSCSSVFLSLQAGNLDKLEDLYDLLDRAIEDEPPVSLREGKLIKEGFSEEIDELNRARKEGHKWFTSLEAEERERTGIKNLKVGFNKVFGYYIEVSASNLSKVPDDYIRKQTIANGERYITAKLKDMESSVLGAQERLVALEYKTFMNVRDRICDQMERIMKVARAIASTDAILSLAIAAVKNNYCKPEINMSNRLVIKDGRHPVVEKMLNDSLFVPNDTNLDCNENRAAIITGPNMAGKSTYMRQTALIVIMAQMGSFVPASNCECGVIDKIFTRIGASDNLSAGQSTFMMEMSEVAYILKNATKKSLCILDEIGRGTSTFDGLSIAWAVIEHISKNIRAKTLFATHYHELTVLEDTLEGVKNYNTACKKRGDDITFLRKIVRGGTDDSYGIEVAKLAGVPETVIKRAKDVLLNVESGNKAEVVKIKEPLEEEQISFNAFTDNKVVDAIKDIDITTLTPIEALNKLYELQKMI